MAKLINFEQAAMSSRKPQFKYWYKVAGFFSAYTLFPAFWEPEHVPFSNDNRRV